MADDDYRVTLSGPGVSLDKAVSQQVALAILQMALGGGTGPSGPVVAETPTGAERREPRLSLREFLDAAAARSNPEKIAVFAGYLRDHLLQDDFSREEVKSCFRSAGEPLPGNFARDFQLAVQNGWVAEDHGKPGRYYITRKGDETVRRRADGI